MSKSAKGFVLALVTLFWSSTAARAVTKIDYENLIFANRTLQVLDVKLLAPGSDVINMEIRLMGPCDQRFFVQQEPEENQPWFMLNGDDQKLRFVMARAARETDFLLAECEHEVEYRWEPRYYSLESTKNLRLSIHHTYVEDCTVESGGFAINTYYQPVIVSADVNLQGEVSNITQEMGSQTLAWSMMYSAPPLGMNCQ